MKQQSPGSYLVPLVSHNTIISTGMATRHSPPVQTELTGMARSSVRNHPLRLALLHTAWRIVMHLQNFPHRKCCQNEKFGCVMVTNNITIFMVMIIRQSYTRKQHVWYATLNAQCCKNFCSRQSKHSTDLTFFLPSLDTLESPESPIK